MKSIVPCLLFVSLCTLSSPAWAVGNYHSGDGSHEDPFQILTPQHLYELGRHPEDYDKHFVLVDDIDIGINAPGGKTFQQAVIAPDTDPFTDYFQGTAFSGTFDGNGYRIRNLTIEYPYREYLGLFGKIDTTGIVMDLVLENAGVLSMPDPYNYMGSLAGENQGFVIGCYASCFLLGEDYIGGLVGINYGDVIDCHTAGIVQGIDYVGGLVGFSSSSFIQKCSSICSVYGYIHTGGLIGYSIDSLVSYCFAFGPVQGDLNTNNRTGGLAGYSSGDVYRCYATGSVYGRFAGGLIGVNTGTIDNCYAVGLLNGTYRGGLSPSTNPTVYDSFWDIYTTGVGEPGEGTGLPTWQMMQQQTFLDAFWDFDTVWTMEEEQTYPYFQWQEIATQILCQDGLPYPMGDFNTDCVVDLQDFALFALHWMEDLRP